MKSKGIITAEEMQLCRQCVADALRFGASDIRVSLSKSAQSSICIIDGEVDKISYNEDRSIFVHIFANGSYGTFSTNRLDPEQLSEFIRKGVETTSVLTPDKNRMLPDRQRTANGCTQGDELGLYDDAYFNISSEEKIAYALRATSGPSEGEGWILDCAESEYSDSLDDNFMIDSKGFEGRHIETSFGVCCEAAIEDGDGNIYSGYWWNNNPFWKNVQEDNVYLKALECATENLHPKAIESGKYNIIVKNSAGSRLIGPIINAMDGFSVQQSNSFLDGRLGEKVFSEHLTIRDMAHAKGKAGSRLFDTEGVATKETAIIEKGVVKQLFINTYIAGKTGWEPTVEGVSRPCLEPYICNSNKNEINLNDISAIIGRGVFITGFNGGNCNQVSGNFSFGIEGIYFEDGKPVHPIREAVMTGNIIDLWNKVLAIGSDPRDCARWQIPTLAFEDIDISA